MIVFAHTERDLLSRFLAFSVVSVCFTGSNTMTRPLFVLAMGLGSTSSSDISIGEVGLLDALVFEDDEDTIGSQIGDEDVEVQLLLATLYCG